MSDKLLTTREASTFLRVSEASVRRWTDAGILTASRVGRRGARRFREADLLRFMQPGQKGRPPADAAARAIVIQGMAVALGSHLVSFYSNDAGRLRVGVPFLRDGLLAGQACVMYVTAPLREHYLKALSGEGVDVDAAISTGLLRFMSTRRQPAAGWIGAGALPGRASGGSSEPGVRAGAAITRATAGAGSPAVARRDALPI